MSDQEEIWERYYQLIEKLGWENVSRETSYLEWRPMRDVYEATIFGVLGKPREMTSLRYRVDYEFPPGFLEGTSDVSEEKVIADLEEERQATWDWMHENTPDWVGWKNAN